MFFLQSSIFASKPHYSDPQLQKYGLCRRQGPFTIISMVIPVWNGKFRSRCLKINRAIKSAASAASPMTKMQGSPHPRLAVARASISAEI